ncbi:MAG TPA: PAS domain S-box protein [Arenimonas sp.]|uniref:PAS domain S-box protein n=1 Tax=Arenimonas sp. TaxID=1872635 RepID=UPI002BDC3A03|nr:PAS domain S-box protein [Arenimonas sp.]HMB57439.1 PAS domain S-box protein [Arenimonas sp.]
MRLFEAFASSESIVALLNAADGRFRDVNPAFERITGYRRDQVIGRTPMEIGLWNDPEFRAGLWESLRVERRVVNAATLIGCADGRVLPGRLHVETLASEGAPEIFCLLQILPDDNEIQAIQRREILHREIFLNAAEGIFRSLPGGGLIDANPAMARILGYESPAQLLLALSVSARAVYVDAAEADEVVGLLARDGSVVQKRVRVRRRDGSMIWARLNARMIRDEQGQPRFYEGSIEDITAQVDAEEALKQTRSLYRVLLDNSRDGVFLIQHGKVCFANEAMAKILGYVAEDLIGMDYFQLIDPADAAAQQSRRQQRESGSRDLQVYEVHMRRKDGETILCEVRADAVDFQGEIASTGTLRDVTQERRSQRAIIEAEARYRELFHDSPAGLFRSGLDGAIIEVNPVMASMAGYDSVEQLRAEVKGMGDVYAIPEQRQAMLERALRDGYFNGVEIQIRRRDNRRHWVSASVRVDRDAAGNPQSFTGSVLDVDSQHQMQQALLRSESKYRTLVELSNVGVFIIRDSFFVYVNRSLAQMLGYTEEELTGKDYFQYLAPEAVMRTTRDRAAYREAGSIPQHYETCFLHRNGGRVYVQVSLSSVQLDGIAHSTGTILDITRQREAESRLRFHATHDPLTGLPNRALFNRRLAERLAPEDRRGRNSYAVIFLDLDGFKWVNDSLGHSAGDRLLLEIARRLENELIQDVLIARYGGDEFTLLPEGPCDYERAVGIARRVIDLFEQPFEIGGQQVFSAASLGIVLGRSDYESPDQVLRDADTAMYRAKAAGKSGFVVFDEEMHTQARARLRLETDFRLAFERSEFLLYYQPIVELTSGRLVGAEALVRWRHPERGILSPGEFLPVAEETGLITGLDAWVMGEACRQLSRWRRLSQVPEAFVINVNVDERQMASKEMLDDVFNLLHTFKLPAGRLRLEVTETVFRSGRKHAEAQLGALKALGVGLAVDDFGTGYSSLESFAASPFDALKIDQIFVRDLATNPRHRAIVRTIIGFAKDLGLLLTAEGIEDEDQRQLLIELGCEFGQGYLFAKPLSPEEFEQRL